MPNESMFFKSYGWFSFKSSNRVPLVQSSRPHRNGHGIHSPFLFAYLQEVVYYKTSESFLLTGIRELKRKLLRSEEIVGVKDLGAGSHGLKQAKRTIADIAKNSSITHSTIGKLLHHTISYFKSNMIIELGTCLGFGALYLASGNKTATLITIEGSDVLVKKSTENFSADENGQYQCH